jgi:hypothetical protein
VLRTLGHAGRWGQRLDLLSDATLASAEELRHARALRDLRAAVLRDHPIEMVEPLFGLRARG